jgi:hypothetical protein
MVKEPFHLSDEEILLVADGEASRRRARQAYAHLTTCGTCRTRVAELQGTIADFVSLHRDALDAQLPAAAGPRALLKARLSEAAAHSSIGTSPRWLLFSPRRAAACLCAAGLIAGLGAKLIVRQSHLHGAGQDLSWASMAIPDRNLTPGATRPVNLSEVCSMAHEEVVREVPESLRQQVFREYGILNPHSEDYEIDYLIAPGLGGTEDIHNLWPEPSSSLAWNAHVKDALEERLHELVCAGELDLPTAQRAIATDWITAYKRYLGREQYASPARRPA